MGQQTDNGEEHEAGPAPVRDLSGVWTRVRPEGTFSSGSTWTPEPPVLTEWREFYDYLGS